MESIQLCHNLVSLQTLKDTFHWNPQIFCLEFFYVFVFEVDYDILSCNVFIRFYINIMLVL